MCVLDGGSSRLWECGILAVFPGQLMWRAGADWCVQLGTAAADLCETMLSVFPGSPLLQKERERECAV